MPRRHVIPLLTAVLLIAGVGYWQWGVKRWSGEHVESLRVTDLVELTVAEFRHPDAEAVRITAIRCDPLSNKLAIIFSGEEQGAQPQNFIAMGGREHAVAMINGSYFDASFQPVGLVISDGQAISELSQQPALSGVLAIYQNRSVQLIPRRSYRSDAAIASAIQAGPFVVDPGSVPGIKSDDLKKAKRTAIGQTVAGDIVFITTTPCTLFQLSEILTQHPDVLGVEAFDRVLNLDGGPSTGLYVSGLEAYHVIPETAVPNTIAIQRRWH